LILFRSFVVNDMLARRRRDAALQRKRRDQQRND
jgi:hypothetical protein